jgi:copper resistance protein B
MTRSVGLPGLRALPRIVASSFVGAIVAAFALSPGCAAQAQAQEIPDHIPPSPPAQPMQAMSDREMTRVMEMDDDARLAMFKLDELERGRSDDATSTAWNAQAWYGGDFDKLWLRSEGERAAGQTDGRVEGFWDHAFASYWDWQFGARRDFGAGADRSWAAFGVQGLAPYWFTIEATAYVGANGRSAARFRVEYELLLTQRLVLQPEFEANLYGKDDRERAISSGLSDAELGLRLRYEFVRKFAPYVGIVRTYRRGTDASSTMLPFPAPIPGGSETRLIAGFRMWL